MDDDEFQPLKLSRDGYRSLLNDLHDRIQEDMVTMSDDSAALACQVLLSYIETDMVDGDFAKEDT